ncbi:NAD-dependent epimerase/dehydratase family protein [Lichenibacterium ramalinae]|uniref:NAD-dependent epimerase/dehydratase family protein n=1 Tax=Lichenibacterium ramalinae TaxID=2316527 RepID=A0A4Q2RBQ3_9HYPH|nr:NAD-dependent epimerase/dehydratase family protein [Lichenibacterium ramalinae]RYB03492.1 NAD-dependent epimerase/dehydratase family protein [Lichenibacterium ramalinae]
MTDQQTAGSTGRRGRVVVTGAAGLVGQNLIPRLKARGYADIVAIDKHRANTRILAGLHPDIRVVEADLSRPGGWEDTFAGAEAVVQLHAQIGGLDAAVFDANNVVATRLVLAAAAAAGIGYLVHISSSVVNSAAVDLYTETKKAQETLVDACAIPHVVLRPTLMFGWFDRKHVGWLARFMKKVPVFPVPGDGKFRRQPLYAGDFSNIIMSCLERRLTGSYNISGLRTLDYIDMMRAVKKASGAGARIVKIPYGLFRRLLLTYALVDKDPPFTANQLAALVTPDLFEVIDWPGIFGVIPTPLDAAFHETFNDPRFASVVLDF